MDQLVSDWRYLACFTNNQMHYISSIFEILS